MRIPVDIALGLIGLFSSSTPLSEEKVFDPSNTTHPWLDTFRPHSERIRLLQANLTLNDKLRFIEGAAALENHGVGAAINPCIGLIKASHRLGLPNLCMGDGPSGVSNGLGNVTTFPAPIVVASSWDPQLMYDYAKAIAREHRHKGHNVALTPTMNIQRSPLWGRNAESLSEDPYLTSRLAIANVKGTQSEHVLASPKHFAAYNQETNRFGHAPAWSATNVIVSNRTLQELYFPAFKAVVENANPGSIMTSYNKVNGEHASENYAILSDLFSWGFDNGFTVTDWYFGQRSTLDAALAGQTMSMPGGKSDFGFEDFYAMHTMKEVLRNGSLPMAVLDDMVRRVITPMFEHGLVDDRELGDVMNDVRSRDHHELAVKVVEEGSILLKNEHSALPLGPEIQKIAVIGAGGHYGALVTERYGGFVGSPNLNETLVTPLQGIRGKGGETVEVTYAQGHTQLGDFGAVPASAFRQGMNMTLFATPDWTGPPFFSETAQNLTAAFRLDVDLSLPQGVSAIFEGVLTPSEDGVHQFSLYAGGFAKLHIDGKQVTWLRKEDFVNYATGEIALRRGSDVSFRLEYSSAPAITSVGLDVGWVLPSVRQSLLSEASEVATRSDAAIVFVGNVLSEGGDGTSDVQAVLLQWYAGEGVGTALANLLFGDTNPSGKLAVTFPASDSDGPTAARASFPGPTGDLMSDNADVFYDEGLYVGYKWFDHHAVQPLFPFGHGLSYTSFEVCKIHVRVDKNLRVHLASSVTNTGSRDGREVVQLYVGYPQDAEEPPKLLKRFEKVSVKAGETKMVDFMLDSTTDLQYWSEDREGWAFASGEYTFYMGTSSRHIAWSETVNIKP